MSTEIKHFTTVGGNNVDNMSADELIANIAQARKDLKRYEAEADESKVAAQLLARAFTTQGA